MIFFARYEASEYGSPFVETEHILLGVLRQDRALANRFLQQADSYASIRKQVDARSFSRDKVSTSVDLPLSNESKRVLGYAAEEAEGLSHKHIGTEHLLLGLLREEKSFAAEMSKERGLRLSELRKQLAELPPGQTGSVLAERSTLIEFVDSRGQCLATSQGQFPNLPRVGESVSLGDRDTRKRYTVHEITYEYQQISATLPKPVHVLERILIVLAEESGGSGE